LYDRSEDFETIDLWLDSTLDAVDLAEEAALKQAQTIGFHEDDLHESAWRCANAW